MNYYNLLVPTIIISSILLSIIVSKNEDKKDVERKNKEMENLILNDFVNLYKRQKRKIEYEKYLESNHWKEIRKKALKRAGYKCQLCASNKELNVHHNTYKNLGHEDLNDLVVLCRNCHKKFHNIH
mgnify:CR=1 FL=1